MIFSKPSIKLLDDISLQKVHLLRILENLNITSLLLRHRLKLLDQFGDFLTRREIRQPDLVVGPDTELYDVLLEPQVGEVLQIVSSLHAVVDLLDDGEAFLLLDEVGVVLAVHFPYLCHVDLLLDFRVVAGVLGAEG